MHQRNSNPLTGTNKVSAQTQNESLSKGEKLDTNISLPVHINITVSFFNHLSQISRQFYQMFKKTSNRFQQDQSWLLNIAPVFWNI